MTGPASPNSTRRLVLLCLLLVAVVFAIYRLRGFTHGPRAARPDAVPVTPVTPVAADDVGHVVTGDSAVHGQTDGGTTRRDRTARDELREKIYRSFGRPVPPPPSGAKAAPATWGPDAGTLDAAYIRKRIRQDFVPLAKECYEAALERDPKLRGKLVFNFVIAGDEDVGGIVESAELDPSSTLAEKELVYCLRESLLSLSFEPPQNGGIVTVTYPFIFSPDTPDAGH